ncbi:MAG TPA: transcriptional regulator [Rhodobacteraceae bacterium]|jgi:DNA-binding transcriptional ArsR family regulator|nr:winged helix-turn-helix transcriptional regulator [Paracoccaceae bacterium]HBG98082.1 transcriptional regulator [Paracoccaceae bacterium]
MTIRDRRLAAAIALDRTLDPDFFGALCHPVRLALIRALVLTGESDIGDLASGFAQDRSVISRHLAMLERAGITVSRRAGRRVLHDLDGPFLLARLDALRGAAAGLADICCPGSARKDEQDDPTGTA